MDSFPQRLNPVLSYPKLSQALLNAAEGRPGLGDDGAACRYVRVLRHLPESQVTWPTQAEMIESAELIHRRHLAIDGAFGFIDGLSLPVETSSDPRTQEATYNGWHHSRRINNILVFAPTGEFDGSKVLKNLLAYRIICLLRVYHSMQAQRTRELA
jgi:hypothetical protein